MNPDQAIQLISGVLKQLKMSLDEHAQLQEALKILSKAISKKESPDAIVQ